MESVGSAFNDPLVLILISGIVGYFIAEFRKGRDGITSARVTDANVLARLDAVELWIRDNRSLHADFRSLTAIVEGLAKNVEKANEDMARSFDRLTRRVDSWMASQPLHLRNRVRSPFDVPDAREWIDDDMREQYWSVDK